MKSERLCFQLPDELLLLRESEAHHVLDQAFASSGHQLRSVTHGGHTRHFCSRCQCSLPASQWKAWLARPCKGNSDTAEYSTASLRPAQE
eukprot:5100503-Karenia_brevis.AAC.1